MSNIKRTSRTSAFSLVELLLVLAILAILGSLLLPVLDTVRRQRDATACLSHLRQIGTALQLKIQDNGNTIPQIETDPTSPIYPAADGVKTLLETLRPYGLTEQNVQCPADLSGPNSFAKRGTSYEWKPMVDGENASNPQIYAPFGAIQIPMSRLRMVTDFESVHHERQNILYGDGHVRGF